MLAHKIILLFSCCCMVFACQEELKPIKDIKEIKVEVNKESASISHIIEDVTTFQQILERDKGNVVLVNLWASWCKPCIHEMPALEKLHQTYAEQGIKVIALSIDDINHIDSLVTPYWEEMNFSMDYFVVGGNDPGALVNSIDPLWLGVVPTTFIFDQDGKRVDSFTGRKSYKEFEKKALAVRTMNE